ncbi:MAG TPA: polysaccharide biosynthesis protein [Candidatus Limnocylindrales bacterium]|nr:polysaccharide biosynthesis protein [Candidatus Limnocylindrales bacterium]
MNTSIRGATVLITGGTGSFGHRVTRSLLRNDPAEVRIYSRDEKKQWDMQRAYPDLRFFVGDVRDRRRLREAMRGVDFVFHAAALKQVPSCEVAPMEAIQTNTLGSFNVCEAATEARVKSVVALSTDKAVKPVNAMGMTKALMEKIICAQNLSPSATTFSCVRYGNVMGSRGSVIPLFLDQVRRGDPLTVTVPTMTRFLITLDESVDLVYRAMTSALGGEVFVRRAPACTVFDLANAVRMWRSPDGDAHPILTTGIRPGEKIHEVLVNEYEMQRAIAEDGYFTISPEYRPAVPTTPVPVGIEYTSENTERISSPAEIVALLERMGQIEGYG